MYSAHILSSLTPRPASADGWTLLELMAVVAVVGILLAIGVGYARGAKKNGLDGEAKAAVTQAASAGVRFASLREGLFAGYVQRDLDGVAPLERVLEPLNAKQLNQTDTSFLGEGAGGDPPALTVPGPSAKPWAIHILVSTDRTTATFCSASKAGRVFCVRRQANARPLYRSGTAGQTFQDVATYTGPTDPNWRVEAFK